MRQLSWVIVIGMVLGLGLSAQAATYGGGSGTAVDPYQIWTPEQMNTIGANSGDWGKSFKLMADIDMGTYTGTQYNVIGNNTTNFTGTFDGDNHSISNLTYVGGTSLANFGLFGYIKNAVICNLSLKNASMDLTGNLVSFPYFGGLAGRQEGGSITHCSVDGNFTVAYTAGSSMSCAGKLVGYGTGGSISNCSCTGSISVYSYTTGTLAMTYSAGLIGQNGNTVINCSNTGPVFSISYALNGNSVAYAGGLIGYNNSTGPIINCCSRGSVYAFAPYNSSNTSTAGGLIGRGLGSITSSYWAGIMGAISYKGGLVGRNDSCTATNCLWDTTSGITSGAGYGTAISTGGMTTAQMQTLATFTAAGWDFSDTDGDAADWIMPAVGYPYLAWKECQTYPAGDLDQSCTVDINDFAIFAANWLTCTAPACN